MKNMYSEPKTDVVTLLAGAVMLPEQSPTDGSMDPNGAPLRRPNW